MKKQFTENPIPYITRDWFRFASGAWLDPWQYLLPSIVQVFLMARPDNTLSKHAYTEVTTAQERKIPVIFYWQDKRQQTEEPYSDLLRKEIFQFRLLQGGKNDHFYAQLIV